MPTDKSMERALKVHTENCCMKFAGESRMTEAIATAIDEAVAEEREALRVRISKATLDDMVIGPLYNAGWNAAVAFAAEKLIPRREEGNEGIPHVPHAANHTSQPGNLVKRGDENA